VPNDAETSDELSTVFRDGSVFSADDEKLNKYLKHLCSGHVPNEMVRHREMNRCQVITTIKTFRFINSVEKSNKIFTGIIILLTIVTIALSYYATTQSQESSDKMERLVHSQEMKEKRIIGNLSRQIDSQNDAIAKLVSQNEKLVNELKAISSSNNELASTIKENMAYNKSLKTDVVQKTRSAP
jgi:hypothetical protein